MKITSTSNQFIKDLKKQKAKNRFLLFLDTPKLVAEGLNAGFNPKYIFVEIGKHFDFLSKIEVIEASSQIIKTFSNVEENAGIVGVFSFEKKEFKKPIGNFLVLDNIQDGGNVGTLLRSALGADFKEVFLLDCASVTNEKVIRSSAGAIFRLNIYEMTKIEFILKFKEKNLFYADMKGKNIFDLSLKPPQHLGLVVGNEGSGVSNELKEICSGSFSVPMKNSLESLNAAVSGSIIMFCLTAK